MAIDYKIQGNVNQVSLIKKIREVNNCSLLEAKKMYRAMMVFHHNAKNYVEPHQ